MIVWALLMAQVSLHPCINFGTTTTAHQAGIVVKFGKGRGRPRVERSVIKCPQPIDPDLLKPPFPFSDNMTWPKPLK